MTRLKLPVLLRRDALCPQIEKLLHELSGVTGVEVHARTGSVILEHPGGLVEIAAVLEIIDEALARPVSQGNCSLVLPTKSTKCKLSGTDCSLKNTDKKNHVSGSVLVAMVGDGINDTPAFACSDLSFAIGEGGADVAVEYADIVLQHGDLALVAETVGLGQKTVSVIRQDYAMAIGLNSIGLVMTTLGWITPFVGAFLHNVITLIVVSNSAKLLAYKKDPNVLAEKSSGRNQFYGSNLVSQSILS